MTMQRKNISFVPGKYPFIFIDCMLVIFCTAIFTLHSFAQNTTEKIGNLKQSFVAPPPSARPGVFWQWMGGLISKEGLTKDLEAMSAQGIGAVMVMQMPDQAPYPQRWDFRDYPGKVKVLSDEWFALVNHAIGEADRLGITFSIFISPGWSHAGGPWVTPEKGLKKLVSGNVEIKGPLEFKKNIARAPRSLGMGGGNEVPGWFNANAVLPHTEQLPDFYRDVAVIAVPKVVKNEVISQNKIIDLTSRMNDNGMLNWDVPSGEWTIMRLGVASENGVNHPAPFEATGLESDRMDPEATQMVFDGMISRIIREAKAKGYTSFKAFETDSYEGGIQDFGVDFRDQFRQRRSYDCIPWLSSWLDKTQVIGSKELTDRFRNDMIRTISELMDERFHQKLRSIADENKVEWMIEPYFRLQIDWRTSGARSSLPGTEFWIGKPFGYIGPGPDIAALYGLPVVWAEAFTAESYTSAWRNDPFVMKPWGDAVFSRGVNQFYTHGFVHNPFGDHLQPGMTMGYWGTQTGRYVTWWPYAGSWHRYLTRCQYMLRQGRPVNDVLAFPGRIQPVPNKAVDAGPFRQVVLNDEALMQRIWVREDGRIAVKGGGDFAALTLTPGLTLRPEALRKIRDLVSKGAILIGEAPPRMSSSLQNYPQCDKEISVLIDELWNTRGSGIFNEHSFGKGKVMATSKLAGALHKITGGADVQFLSASGSQPPEFLSIPEVKFNFMDLILLTGPSTQVNAVSDKIFKSLDFVHRREGETDIYFVCNTGDSALNVVADFRVNGRVPELWNAVSGEMHELSGWQQQRGRTKVAMSFAPRQSFFVVFKKKTSKQTSGILTAQTPAQTLLKQFTGSWDVSFNPRWGGPQKIVFDQLQDWSKHTNKGIKYYSGTAVYTKQFDLAKVPSSKIMLDLGKVHNLARVSVNGRNLGVVWCAPWSVEMPVGLLKKKGNSVKIEVVNTWVNRLIGDEQEPEDCELVEWNPNTNRKGSYDINIGSRGLKDLPDWVINGTKRPSPGRYTFTSWRFYDKDAPLQPAGLLGPVKLISDLEK